MLNQTRRSALGTRLGPRSRALLSSLCVLTFVALSSRPAFAQPSKAENTPIPGQLVVRARSIEHVPAMMGEVRAMGNPVLWQSRRGDLIALLVPVGREFELSEHLRRAEWAKWAVQDFTAPGSSEFIPPPSEMPQAAPGTPLPWEEHDLWFLQNTGQSIAAYTTSQQPAQAGVAGEDLDALGAWHISQGDPSVWVAVLDSGIDHTLQEFSGRLASEELNYTCGASYTPPPECSSNFNPNWCYPTPGIGVPTDNHGHGTAAASVLGANVDNGSPTVLNGLQFAGVDPSCTIVRARVSYNNVFGFGALLAALSDLLEPEFSNVKVISISFQGFNCPLPPANDDPMLDLTDAIVELHGSGKVIVTAAGNFHLYNDKCPNRWNEVIMVAATENTGQVASFSGYGPYLDFAAPGWGMYTVPWSNSCDQIEPYSSGTSAATPAVAGIVSLLFARAAVLSIDLTPAIAYDCLKYSTVASGSPTWNEDYGWGKVNARRALLYLEDNYYSCDADLTHSDDPLEFGYGIADGSVTIDDLNYFVYWHTLGVVSIADIASCGDCTSSPCGVPDGIVDDSDLAYYLCLWSEGCP